ncbi:MAG TPA: cytochrome c [Blastocatellia bacterium]|nr:cytochrome c [Blastocatellia bacterium]
MVENITPDRETGAGAWTDDMLARAIREGIGHDGRTLFPLMPYTRYRAMSDEDLASVIVYLRSLPGVHRQMPKTEINFPVNRLIKGVPRPITRPVVAPDLSTAIKRGSYLANIANCVECHTPRNRGQAIAGLEFAGGFPFDTPQGTVASANITPDPTGIPYYDEQTFVQTLRAGQVKARKLNPVMPWAVYRNMTDEDLKALYAYVRTIKPVKHRVDNTEKPTLCKLCKQVHGSGASN